MDRPRIALVGTGANGASIGVDLIEAGHDVTFVEQWPEHVEAMRRQGVRVELETGVRHARPRVMHLCELATLRSRFDLVLIVTKAYDARWAAELIRPHLAESGLVVGLQNGMSAQPIAAVVGAVRSVGAVIEVSSTLLSPGVVRRYTDRDASWFAVGPMDEAGAGRAREVAEVLRCAGEVAVVDDILATKWMKLVSNASVLVPTALLDLPMVDAARVRGVRAQMEAAGQEALRVGLARGFPVLPIFGLASSDIERPESVVTLMLDRLWERFTKPGAITTVLQDWRQGRRSEADDIHGEVIRAAAGLAIDVSVNARMLDLARQVERGALRPGADRIDDLLGATLAS